MKYTSLLFTLALALFAVSCDNLDLDEQLNDPNRVSPETAELDLVLNNVFLEFTEFVDEASDETMPYVRLSAMDAGDRYDNQDGPTSFDFIWFKAYAEILPDVNLAITLAEEADFTVPAAAAKTIKAYIMMTLVDMFGDVPYSEAFQGITNSSPKADPGADVYAAALGLLDEAAADLANPKGSIANDLYYGGDTDKWMALVNSLRLRYHVNTRLVGGSAAAINDMISSGVIEDEAGDFEFQYGLSRVNPDSRHPYYSDGYEAGGPSWYLSNYYMWLFFADKNNEDPRLRYYFFRQDCDETNEDFFTLDCQNGPYPSHWPQGYPYCTASSPLFGGADAQYTGYWGRDHGNDDGIPPDDLKRTAWGLYPAGGKFDADNCGGVSNGGSDGARGAGIQPMLLSSYVYFLRAEAALTMGTSDDARAMLEAAITASIDKVMNFQPLTADETALAPTQDDVDAYLAEVLSAYDGATNDDDRLDIIVKEYFLALQGMGLEAYNAYRRTCHPVGLQPVRAASPGDFARSMWYPASYVNRNASASQKSGVTDPVFWDTNAPGCVN